MKKATLYYDGQCPLCSTEMKHLEQRASSELELVDIHALEKLPADKDSMLKRLHLHTEDGFITGLDANVAMWQYTSIGWCWRVLQWPLVKPIATWVYDKWATKRFDKRYGHSHKSSS